MSISRCDIGFSRIQVLSRSLDCVEPQILADVGFKCGSLWSCRKDFVVPALRVVGDAERTVHVLGVDVVRFRAGTSELIESEAVLVGRRGWSQVRSIQLRFLAISLLNYHKLLPSESLRAT